MLARSHRLDLHRCCTSDQCIRVAELHRFKPICHCSSAVATSRRYKTTNLGCQKILHSQTQSFEYQHTRTHPPKTTAIMSSFIGPNMYLIESLKSEGLYLNLDGGNKADGTKVVSK